MTRYMTILVNFEVDICESQVKKGFAIKFCDIDLDS